MKSAKNRNKFAKTGSAFQGLESLEDRKLMTAAWGPWPVFLGQDKVVANYPWLTGAGFGVAVVDKGIDYWHPQLGGDRATGTKSPRIVNVYDYRDNDTNPFPSESQVTDVSSAHGTGVAGVLVAVPYDLPAVKNGHAAQHYQGILQGSLLYNLRTDRFNSQDTIKQALQWVVDNHAKYNITAVNLTDFVGTNALTPAYDAQAKALWDAGVFIITPIANDWLGTDTTPPKQPIGFPAKSPYIFGSGGIYLNGQINPKTQRGPGLDLLSQSHQVTLPYYTPSTDTDVLVDNAGDGNSWGAPTILGTAVLMQQIDPTITPAQIMAILQATGVNVVDPDGTGAYKRLDMYAAIQATYAQRDDQFDQVQGGNDDLQHAGAMTFDNNGKATLSGLKLLIHDNDYFTFTAGTAGDYDVKIGYSGPSTQPQGELLDVDGNLVATIGPNGLSSQHLEAGQYYLHLYNPDASLNGQYSLSVADSGGVVTPPPPAVGANGTFNAALYDKAGNFDFAWYDNASGTLKYAQRNAAKTFGSVQTVDNGTAVGLFVSMALDSQQHPGIAFYDANNADLKYAHFNGSTWDVQTVDATFTTGYYPSLQFDDSDAPVISYYDKTHADLKFAQVNSGGTWSISTIDSKGDVGRYSSLQLSPSTGRWAVAYESTSGGAFKYAEQAKSGLWSTQTIDTNGAGGGFISLAFDAAGLPSFSYYDAANSDLRFARYNGAAWSKTTVASRRSQGLYTNVFYDGANPVIYYYNKTADALIAARSDGKIWNYETLTAGGGRENRVAIDADGFETFTWYESATGNLKVTDL